MKLFNYLLYCVLVSICVLCNSCYGGGSSSNATPTPSGNASLTAIKVNNESNLYIPYDTAQKIAAIGVYSDGTIKDLTDQVAWNIADNSKVGLRVSSAGVVASSESDGAVGLSASYQDVVSKTIMVYVTNATLKSITLQMRSEFKDTTTIPVGADNSYIMAVGHYSNGRILDISSQVIWSSSDASILKVVPNTGYMYPLHSGNTVITVSDGSTGITADQTIAVSNAVLSKIVLSQSCSSNNKLPVGVSCQIIADGYYSDDSILPLTASLSWESSNENIISVGNYSATKGLIKALSSVSTSPITITATDSASGISSSLQFDVTAAQISSLSIKTDLYTIPIGTSGKVDVYANYTDGSIVLINSDTNLKWESSDPNTMLATTGEVDIPSNAVVGSHANLILTYPGLNSVSIPFTTSAPLVTGVLATVSPIDAVAGLANNLHVDADFSDGVRQDVSSKSKWVAYNSNIFTFSNDFLTATPDANLSEQKEVSLQAFFDNVPSDLIYITVDPRKLTLYAVSYAYTLRRLTANSNDELLMYEGGAAPKDDIGSLYMMANYHDSSHNTAVEFNSNITAAISNTTNCWKFIQTVGAFNMKLLYVFYRPGSDICDTNLMVTDNGVDTPYTQVFHLYITTEHLPS